MKIAARHEVLSPIQLANTQKLIEALRSGDFTQGINRLRNEDNHYCCLGVASAIQDVPFRQGIQGGYQYHCDMGLANNFPDCNWWETTYGWNWEAFYCKDDKANISLSVLNDGGYKFKALANLIEATILKHEEIYLTKDGLP